MRELCLLQLLMLRSHLLQFLAPEFLQPCSDCSFWPQIHSCPSRRLLAPQPYSTCRRGIVRFHGKTAKKGFNKNIGQTGGQVQHSVRQAHWPTLVFTKLSPFCSPLSSSSTFFLKFCIVPQTQSKYLQSLCSHYLPLLTSYKVQAGPLQSCAYSFLIVHQIVTGGMITYSLSLRYESPCGFACGFISSFCIEKVLDWTTLIREVLSPFIPLHNPSLFNGRKVMLLP